MKILQVYRDYFSVLHGGIERHVRELAHGLQPQINVEILAAGRRLRGTTIREENVLVHMAPELARFQGLPLCPTFGQIMRRGSYDLIHLHLPTPMGQAGYAMSGRGCPAVATYHADLHRGSTAIRRGYNEMLKRTLPSYQRVIASSWELVKSSPVLSELHEEHPKLIEVIPFGVNTDRFCPGSTSRSQTLRERWGPGPVVLFVGRLADYKGLPFLIQAMKDLDAKLVVVGVGVEHDRIMRTGVLELGRRFVYLGDVPEEDLPDVYRAADVFCLPSTSSAEAFGLAALEALATGIPSITTEVGTATSVINKHGETGLVVEPGNPQVLTKALHELLSDHPTRTTMGVNARLRVVEHYDRTLMLSRVHQLLESAT